MSDKSLYERLGGVFAVAAVVDHFSDAIVKNPIVGPESPNPQLREWHTQQLPRLPGLKFMRTLWVCNVAGGPFTYVGTVPGSTPIGLEEAHRRFQITPAEFDEVAAELGRSLDAIGVPAAEKDEVIAAFAAVTGAEPVVTQKDADDLLVDRYGSGSGADPKAVALFEPPHFRGRTLAFVATFRYAASLIRVLVDADTLAVRVESLGRSQRQYMPVG